MTAPDRRHAASSVVQIALLSGLPASLPAGAWTPSFPGRRWSEWSLARLLVRRVLAAPVAEFAQLDPVRRVPPRLVGLVIAPFAVFASQRHCDADISASHSNLDCSARLLRAFTRQNPGPRREAEPRIASRGRWRSDAREAPLKSLRDRIPRQIDSIRYGEGFFRIRSRP